MPEGDVTSNTIAVIGHGSVSVTPDAAVLQVGLEATADSAGDALSRVAEYTEAVLGAAKARGVPDADLQTHGVSLYPQVDDQGRRIVAYVASYSLSLRLRDMATAPATVDAVTRAAGDALRLGGFRLSTSAIQAASAEAGAQAVEDARRRAERLAEAAGVHLGRVLSITEAGAAPPVPGRVLMRAASGAATHVPMEAGTQEVTAQVAVRFEITD